MIIFPAIYYFLAPNLFFKFNNIRRTTNKRSMSCPQCKDHTENSDTYAFNKASAAIAKEADTYAIDKLSSNTKPRPNDIDLYMMYYRIEYTRLLPIYKQKYIAEYATIIASKYASSKDLCHICKNTTEPNYFNQEVSFCFHEIEYDPNCVNCAIKHS
jgi:hypothetical protein